MSVVDFINDDKKIDNNGICFDFLKFSREDPSSKDVFFDYWYKAKHGQCPYRAQCSRYVRTREKHPTYTVQLTLFE